MPRLEIKGLVKRYRGGKEAIRGIDRIIEQGVTALLGPIEFGRSDRLQP